MEKDIKIASDVTREKLNKISRREEFSRGVMVYLLLNEYYEFI